MQKKQKASLFVGRWQPFHKGHKALIETVLRKGKPVVVGIRDTETNASNPYTTQERWTMIQDSLSKYGSLVKIIVVPDIDEICYGRDVGYAIRKIELGKKFAKVSGTKIRNATLKAKPIIWLTGQSGAGKTTIAKALKTRIGGVILDGDDMRQSVSLGLGFSPEDREEHNLRIARLARVLSRDNIVIVSLITPFEKLRRKVDAIAKPTWIYVKRNIPPIKERPFEVPRKFSLMVDSDSQDTQGQIKKIIELFHDLGIEV